MSRSSSKASPSRENTKSFTPPRSLAEVMKSSPRKFETARKIYINGGSENSIFKFLQTNIEKLTKSDYSLIATLEYDDVEKYDYLYVNINNMIPVNEDCNNTAVMSETSQSELGGKSTDKLRKEADSPVIRPRNSYLSTNPGHAESFIDSLRGRKRSSDLSRSTSRLDKTPSAPPMAPPPTLPIICENRIKNFDNILGRISTSQSPFIETNFTELDTKVLPPVKSVMGIPIICANLTIGIICLASNDKFTQKSLEKIEDLMEDCAMYMMLFKEKKSDVDKKNAIQRIKMGSWDGILDIDHYGKIMEMNSSAEEIIGQSQHELYGKKFVDLIPNKKLRKGIAEYIQKIFSHDDSESADNSSISLDTKHKLLGDTGELYLKKSPSDGSNSGSNSASARTYVTLRFIKLSSRAMMIMIRQVDDIVRDRKIAEQSNEYKNMFVANVTHELKTPLNGIIGMGVQLLKTELTDKQRSYCNIILNSGGELSRIIGDILDLSKLEDGRIDIVPRPFSIEECLNTCHRTVDFSIKEKNLEYSQYISPRVPDAIISDSDRLKQIISNLLSNAVKFTDTGKISVRIDAIPRSIDKVATVPSAASSAPPHADKDLYTISVIVADTGIGIKATDMGKLFKPFSQLDQGTTKSYKGTGLGLSISQRLANLMQGNITVESDYGIGTTFTLKFMAKKYNTILITDEFKSQTSPLFKGRRAIVVDDNSINRTVVCGILIDWGMEVTTCPTADEALLFISSGAKFDVGIIDINMPGKDGNQLAQAIRRTNLNLSMIAVSSSGAGQINLELFDDYCEKPINEAELIKKMLSMFSRSGIKPTRPVTERAKKDIRILIVEDNQTNQLVLMDKLEGFGYTNCKVTNDGLEGYNEIKNNPKKYKLIFMDIKMPRMDGKESSINIKNLYGWRETYSMVKSASKKESRESVGDEGHNHTHRKNGKHLIQPSKSLSDVTLRKSGSKTGSHHNSSDLSVSAPLKQPAGKHHDPKYCPFICALSATSVKEEEKILLEKAIFNDYITKPIDDNELVRVLNKFE